MRSASSRQTLNRDRGGLPVSFVVRVEPMSRLAQHASIPIAFLVERIFEISGPGKGLAGTALTDVTVERPWEKDYDAITGGSPTLWLT